MEDVGIIITLIITGLSLCKACLKTWQTENKAGRPLWSWAASAIYVHTKPLATCWRNRLLLYYLSTTTLGAPKMPSPGCMTPPFLYTVGLGCWHRWMKAGIPPRPPYRAIIHGFPMHGSLARESRVLLCYTFCQCIEPSLEWRWGVVSYG